MQGRDVREHEPATQRFRAESIIGVRVTERLEHTSINKFHTKAGHGFAAEDANVLSDTLHGKTVENVGKSNTLSGPDRLVDGVAIQTKYCRSADETVASAFGPDGSYRYSGQRLEVPKDQYEACVELMRERIRLGKVSGVTDPARAEELVHQGSVTYRQAHNIARTGTIDGLVYDLKTHAVGAGCTFGLSFVIQYAQLTWSGATPKEALRESVLAGLGSGAISLSVGVLTSQVLRTRTAAVGRVVMRDAVKMLYRTTYGKAAINKVAEISLGRAVGGGAAINHVAKLARTNVVTSVATTVAASGPDIYRAAVRGSISWAQLGKNVTLNTSSVVGATGGFYAGAAAGAALGSIVPGAGTAIGGVIGGIVGSLGGGTMASFSTKKILDRFVEDDTQKMLRIVDARLGEPAESYLLSEAEFVEVEAKVRKRINTCFLQALHASKDRTAMIATNFEEEFQGIALKRKRITLAEWSATEAIAAIIEEINDEYGQDRDEGVSPRAV